jgi:hypothetical protein
LTHVHLRRLHFALSVMRNPDPLVALVGILDNGGRVTPGSRFPVGWQDGRRVFAVATVEMLGKAIAITNRNSCGLTGERRTGNVRKSPLKPH